MRSGARIEGIVLAAGASKRAGRCKALAPIDGVPLLTRAVHLLTAGGCARVHVVIARPHGEAIVRALPGLSFVRNPRPERGMLASLQAGLSAIAADVDAVLVALVDHPRVHPATVAALVDTWRVHGASVVRPVHHGRRGHPYLIARAAIDALQATPAESSARAILGTLALAIDVAVDDPHVREDLDTPADLVRAGAALPGDAGRV